VAGGNYHVRYTDEVTHVGSGEPVPLRVFTLPDRIVVDVAHQW